MDLMAAVDTNPFSMQVIVCRPALMQFAQNPTLV
jgi:hypothetical protein